MYENMIKFLEKLGAPCTLFFSRQFTQILFRGRELIHSPANKPKRNENCESRHPLDWLGRSNQDGKVAVEIQSPSSSSFIAHRYATFLCSWDVEI